MNIGKEVRLQFRLQQVWLPLDKTAFLLSVSWNVDMGAAILTAHLFTNCSSSDETSHQ